MRIIPWSRNEGDIRAAISAERAYFMLTHGPFFGATIDDITAIGRQVGEGVIQPIGDWVLDTNYSSLSTRGVYLDFGQPVDGSSPGPDPDRELIGVKARLITQCPTYGYSMLSTAFGQTVQCGLVIGFGYDGSSYRLAMNPLGVNNYSETDTVNVSCTGVDTKGQCNQWSIASGPSMSVARLVKLTTVRGKTTETNLGDFYFSFLINVKNP